MPISHTQSSSSRASFSSGCARADADFGIPKYCFCGARMELSPSTFSEHRGRKFYNCPNKDDESLDHKWKWWDDAADEELTMMHLEIEEAKETMKNLYIYPVGGNPSEFEALRVSLEVTGAELGEIRGQLLQTQSDIGMMKEFIAKTGEGVVLLIFVMVVIAISYFLN